MSRTPFALLLGAALFAHPASLAAQNWDEDKEQERERGAPSHFALNLTVGGTGLSIGNSQRVNGLRLNWRDADLGRVNGVNFTIWKSAEPLSGAVTGIALGVLGPGAETIHGLAVGLGGVVTSREMHGIAIGGLGVVSNGDVRALAISGLGVVANHDFTGLGISGLGVVANGSFKGIGVSILGVVANEDFTGFGLSGLGVVANHDFRGIGISGIGTVANGDFEGFGFGLVGMVANGDMTGVAIGGVGAVTNGDFEGIGIGGVGMVANGGITGLAVGVLGGVSSDGILRGAAVGGYMVRIREIRGFSASVLRVKTNTLRGVSIAGFNQVRRVQVGLSIGLLNYARELHGVQVGLLNIAGNNRGLARVLPLLNLHLSKRTDQGEERQ